MPSDESPAKLSDLLEGLRYATQYPATCGIEVEEASGPSTFSRRCGAQVTFTKLKDVDSVVLELPDGLAKHIYSLPLPGHAAPYVLDSGIVGESGRCYFVKHLPSRGKDVWDMGQRSPANWHRRPATARHRRLLETPDSGRGRG